MRVCRLQSPLGLWQLTPTRERVCRIAAQSSTRRYCVRSLSEKAYASGHRVEYRLRTDGQLVVDDFLELRLWLGTAQKDPVDKEARSPGNAYPATSGVRENHRQR